MKFRGTKEAVKKFDYISIKNEEEVKNKSFWVKLSKPIKIDCWSKINALENQHKLTFDNSTSKFSKWPTFGIDSETDSKVTRNY